MDIWTLLKVIAALATVLTGLVAFLKPAMTYGFIGLNANGVRGVSEIRAIFGGLFIALGLAPFFLGPVAYQMLGIVYLGIAVARGFSILYDKSYAKSNIISLITEIVLVAFLIF